MRNEEEERMEMEPCQRITHNWVRLIKLYSVIRKMNMFGQGISLAKPAVVWVCYLDGQISKMWSHGSQKCAKTIGEYSQDELCNLK